MKRCDEDSYDDDGSEEGNPLRIPVVTLYPTILNPILIVHRVTIIVLIYTECAYNTKTGYTISTLETIAKIENEVGK